MTICDRCGRETFGHTMSKFNTEEICFACAKEEKDAPNYKAACDREEAECRRGNYNYAGIGLAPEDREFLAERRARR